ncbi:hypothetical protein GGI13_004946, partial [Coemansia sp. RSA 455]
VRDCRRSDSGVYSSQAAAWPPTHAVSNAATAIRRAVDSCRSPSRPVAYAIGVSDHADANA